MGVALIPLFVLALSANVFAQAQGKNLTTDPNNSDTVKVTVNGGVNLDFVYRSHELTMFIGGFGPGAATPPDPGSDSETTVEGDVFVGFDVELSNNISAQVEFGTVGVDDGATLYYGDATTETIQVREANITLDEFLVQGLSTQLGITTWSFDVRGKGSSFAFDPRNSSSINKNWNTVEMFGGPGTNVQGNLLDVLETAGVVGTWSNEQIQLDVVLLPVVLEGGTPNQDEALYAVDFFYTLDKESGSRVGAILALHAFDPAGFSIVGPPTKDNSGETAMFTFGGGITLNNLVQNLELYAELYLQFGDAGQIDPPGAPVAEESVEAGGIAFQVGGEYNFNGPRVGVNITWISGDDDTGVGPGVLSTDTDVDAFLSYENINDLAILEDMWWGLDWDTNYFAIKFNGAIDFSVAGGTNNLTLEGILGIAQTVEDVAGLGTTGTSSEDGLGNEFDVKATWALNSQVNLHAAVAFLFGSDILEGTMEQVNQTDAEDTATLFYLGFGMGF